MVLTPVGEVPSSMSTAGDTLDDEYMPSVSEKLQKPMLGTTGEHGSPRIDQLGQRSTILSVVELAELTEHGASTGQPAGSAAYLQPICRSVGPRFEWRPVTSRALK